MTIVAGSIASKTFTTLALFQVQDSINSGNSKLLMLFIGIAAVALLIQALVLLGVAFGAMKAQKELARELSEFRHKASAFLDKANSLTVELSPQIRDITSKVNTITGHVEKIAGLVHQKADELAPTVTAANQTILAANQTVADANFKTRAQINRVDEIISGALDATVRLGVAIERGISVPSREVAGILSGIKVGIGTLLNGARSFGSGTRPSRTYTPATPIYPRSNKPDLDL